MYTHCPDCKTVFEVTAQDLTAAAGHVVCGECGTTFSALETLSESIPDQWFEDGSGAGAVRTARAVQVGPEQEAPTGDDAAATDDAAQSPDEDVDGPTEQDNAENAAPDGHAGDDRAQSEEQDVDAADGTPDTDDADADADADAAAEDDAAQEETPPEDPAVEDAPDKVAPGEDVPDEDAPDLEAPGEDAPGEDAPGEDAPDEDAPDEDAPDEDASDGDASDEDAPDEDAPDGDAPDGDAPDEDAPDEDAPDEDAPDGDDAGEDAADEDTRTDTAGDDAFREVAFLDTDEVDDDDWPFVARPAETPEQETPDTDDTDDAVDDAAFVGPPPPAPDPAESGLWSADDEAADARDLREYLLDERPRPWRAVLLGIGSVLLLCTLAAQYLHTVRNELAIHPTLGPYLAQAYAWAGMELDPDWDVAEYRFIGNSSVVDPRAEDTTAQQGPDALVLNASFENRTDSRRPFPLLRVVLRNRWTDVVAARDFAPADYLPDTADRDSLMLPRERVLVRLHLVDPGEDVVGYDLDTCLSSKRSGMRCTNNVAMR